ncbi:hypothetical protein OPAG_08314 [Rhodococcus opacus PD630]|uniref:DUF4913 domain-containing protein n=1 Tax=Rhodococcus opacus TaxID=37919 RepID=UPI00029CCDA0|nr:DUF4913 domain-containing protein [Rhodococcus opacus]AHK35481.1 hypothetical protein Pd630_LPD10031 [Rhodococcus opacus PD630]EHI39068.1 hypothetical protein OPAG_08314 [Rhodococcus opacus PD630]UDH01770.1 DUF4913 domain-containing protein [Rhodococcus opacus PD630]
MTVEGTDDLIQLAAELNALRRQLNALSTSHERTADTAARAVQGLDDLEEQLTVTARGIEDAAQLQPLAEDDSRDGQPDSSAPAAAPHPDPLDVKVLYDWVQENIGEWAQRKTVTTNSSGGFRWCSRWLEHPEAITRLWALRRAWTEAVTQPGAAMTAYFRDCFDPTMNLLSSESGPFHACSPHNHDDAPFLVSAPPPWLPDPNTT